MSQKELPTPVRTFGSFDIVQESTTLSQALVANNYKRARVSELTADDEVEEPVFVDIPTLVAVLIKPDDNIQVGSQQIEEICSDGVPEYVIDAEFQDSNESHNCSASSFENTPINEPTTSGNLAVEVIDSISSVATPLPVSSEAPKKNRLRKQDSIDSGLPLKKFSNLHSLKKYGSIENLPGKKDTVSPIQRSHTNLDKRNGSLDKIKKLNNIKEVDDQKLNNFGNSWKNLSFWAGRDLQRKGSNDSDKSLLDASGILKSKNSTRKQSIDGLKRKTSKDSSSSSSKDELLAVSSVAPDRNSRKGSLDQESIPVRAHTPIQRARRAEIVAAVTERLYSSKKLVGDNNTANPGTTSSTPVSEIRSPESTDVKLASATRMKLQEISRKMLAKRRRICVDTQTENQQTVRLRDTASLTEEPKIISKDASILTDRHEDFESLTFVDSPVTRVKEMSTSTDDSPSQSVIRCKDAGVVTDDYYENYTVINSPRNDSGIMSDDTQNYAESNLSSVEVSDLGRRSVEFAENSTNTRMPLGAPNSGSQTRKEDLVESRCSCYESPCYSGIEHYQERNIKVNNMHNNNRHHHHHHQISNAHTEHCNHDQISHVQTDHNNHCHTPYIQSEHHHRPYVHTEKNVISISLPDMLSIKIESSNALESQIKVFEGNEPIDESTPINLIDNEAQTDSKDALEIGTSTDDMFGRVCFNDFSKSTKPVTSQTDAKTFRIENIFHESRCIMRATPRIEIVTDSLDNVVPKNSLIVTNSIGTSFAPETRNRATGMESVRNYSSRVLLGATGKRLLGTDSFTKNTWPTRWRSVSPNSRRQAGYTRYSPILDSHRSMSNIAMSDTDLCKEAKQPTLSLNNRASLIVDELGLRRDERESLKSEKGVFKIPKDDTVTNKDATDLTSPSIIAIIDRNTASDQDTNFSDDSLDTIEDAVENDQNKSFPIRKLQEKNVKVAIEKGIKKACPPDVVAQTKKDIESQPRVRKAPETHDFEDSQQIELPKLTIHDDSTSNYTTPINDFKSLILGDPCYTVNHTDDFDLTDFGNQSSTSTLRDDEEDSYIDAVDDTNQSFENDACSGTPKSIIKKIPRKLMSFTSKNMEYRKPLCTKKVRFTIPEVSDVTSSDSEVCENMPSEDNNVDGGPRNILEEYLDEAVVFMRNMNSMNEYMSAACASKKNMINRLNHCCDKAKSSNYIEYEGRRISLDDDTDQDVQSDNDDLELNVESYEKCLRSMDRLEECLTKVKRHDAVLRDSYGIGMGKSSGAKLDLAKSSTDFRNTNKAIGRESENQKETKKINSNNGDNNLLAEKGSDKDLVEALDKYAGNSKKHRSRRSCRFSEMRKNNPASYSRLRGRCAVDIDTGIKQESISDYEDRVESSEIEGSTSTNEMDNLQAPDCYLTLTQSTGIGDRGFDKIKSSSLRSRFSLSNYDSSNESYSSNEALSTFMETIDKVANSRRKFKYPGSPRAKFLQLLSERRRIVENTRSTGAS